MNMFVDISCTNSVLTISYLGWSVPLCFTKDGDFSHFGNTTYAQKLTYVVDDGTYYDEHKLTFANPHQSPNVGTEKQYPIIDIGRMNEDGSFGDYASIQVLNIGHYKVRTSTLEK